MRQEITQYAGEAYDIVKTAANDIGSRLPGSEGEKKFADFMQGKLEDIGVKPVREKFLVAPRASIGGIPYAGWIGIAGAALSFIPYFYPLVFFACLATWVWLVLCVFLYKPWFDPMFKQAPSQNVYGEVKKDENYDYTIILSAHLDTSWNWKHSAMLKGNPAPAFIKMGLGIVAFLYLTVMSLVMFILSCKYAWMPISDMASMSAGRLIDYQIMSGVLYDLQIANYVIMPLFVIPCCFFVTMWNDKDPRTASPGAMDNATGIGIAYAATRYFKENPDKLPEGCRIIDLNIGSEEAGLKGSIDFTRRHKNDGLLGGKPCYNINIDSIADHDYFSAIYGDVWQFTKFDRKLEDLLVESITDAGLPKAIRMQNPVGGCDSTPMAKAGIRTITFAAQNPTLTHYYHTFHDVAERFSPETVGLGLDVVLRLVDKIDALQAGSGSAPAKDEAPVQAQQAAQPASAPADDANAFAEAELEELLPEELPADDKK